jgi:hypothetical protein
MKLKQITLRGFRGFNKAGTIPIDDRLTLISAPNSHGKTSISEGFEWLLYGVTSKVALADSKDEYRGSYRNIHLLEPEAPTVTVVLQDGASSVELQSTLSGSDAVLRVDGKVVPEWPFSGELAKIPKPFILQHALKDLLLAAPVDRFNRFAALLGFDELTQVHKDLMAFCTKPPLPAAAVSLNADVDALLLKVASEPQLSLISKSLRKGYSELAATHALIDKHARTLVPPNTAKADLLPALIRQRDEAISKVFAGTVAVFPFTSEEIHQLEEEERVLLERVRSEAITHFTTLLKEGAQHRILQEATFYGLGLELFETDKSVCPFCRRQLGQADVNHLREHHSSLAAQRAGATTLEQARGALETLLADVGQRISEYYKRIASRSKGLLESRDHLEQLRGLLSGEHVGNVAIVENAIQIVDRGLSTFIESEKNLRAGLQAAQSAIGQPISDLVLCEKLAELSIQYVASGRSAQLNLRDLAPALDAAQKALSEQLTKAAGTRVISLTIELLETGRTIEKRMRIADAIERVKAMKTRVDSFVTQVMLEAISGELAHDVMDWYNKIRTVGDPDVHFAGFDMKKTAQGGRVQIKAASYGKDLVSAVSSLSESKLNALGLCISIAVNLKEQSPFEFLIIDDPIQSWDKDHEIQFVSVIRELVQRGKQVVLLSHNSEWIKQVRTGCADINGLYYEITGYLESGPVIHLLPWVEPKQRLHTILAIAEDQSADSIRLQQAEEELRQVLHQFACMLYEGVKGVTKNPAGLNAERVRRMLTECGLPVELINKVGTIFETVDDAHHAEPGYSPNRQKLRQYYEIAVRLGQAVEAKLKDGKTIAVITTGKTA